MRMWFHAVVLFWKSDRKCRCCVVVRAAEGGGGGWWRGQQADAHCSACFTFVAPGSGQLAACDPSWGCGSRGAPPGSPAASSLSSSSSSPLSHHQRRSTETCSRVTRWEFTAYESERTEMLLCLRLGRHCLHHKIVATSASRSFYFRIKRSGLELINPVDINSRSVFQRLSSVWVRADDPLRTRLMLESRTPSAGLHPNTSALRPFLWPHEPSLIRTRGASGPWNTGGPN